MDKVKLFMRMLRASARRLKENDPLRLGASTAFFTIFALPPILILVINLLSLIFNREIISGELFESLQMIFGVQSAELIQGIFNNLLQIERNLLFGLVSIVFFMFVSTTLFVVIKHSINQVWNVKMARHASSLSSTLLGRGISLAIILFSGVLFLAALLSETLLTFLSGYLSQILPRAGYLLIVAANHFVSLVIFTVWFAMLFRYLPDMILRWRAIWIGATFTSVLFSIGQFALTRILALGQLANIYGASASFVVLMLFIFYSSLILYFGAAFTKVYASFTRLDSRLRKHAIEYEITEVRKMKRRGG
jgi:membrane protein